MISFGELHQVVADDEEWEFDEVELDTTSVRRQDIGDAGVVRWHDLNIMYRRGRSSVSPPNIVSHAAPASVSRPTTRLDIL